MWLVGWGAALLAPEILVGRASRFTEKLLKFFNIFMSLHREEDAMCTRLLPTFEKTLSIKKSKTNPAGRRGEKEKNPINYD